MWIYNGRYPETGLKEIAIKSMEYIVDEKGDNRRIYCIESEYNIEYGVYGKDSHWYFLCQPYEDNRLYQWDNSIPYILSFDYETIYDSWKVDLKYKRDRLERELGECNEALKRMAAKAKNL